MIPVTAALVFMWVWTPNSGNAPQGGQWHHAENSFPKMEDCQKVLDAVPVSPYWNQKESSVNVKCSATIPDYEPD